MDERVLSFPDDVAVGYVSAYRGDQWVVHTPARGPVRVPAEARVSLWIRCPMRGLAMLGADDVFSVEPEKKAATDTDLGRLAHLTGLRALHCSKAHEVTDQGLAAIAPLRNLRVLDLYASRVTDAGLVHLAGMVQLEQLHLGLTRVKGPGLAYLSGLQKLECLNLDGTEVDDSVVPHLLRLGALRRIVLGEARLSTKGLAALRAAFPAAQEIYMPRPGQRLARERAQAAVLSILARRLAPDLARDASVMEELRARLPQGSLIAEMRLDDGPPLPVKLAFKELDVAALWLGRLPTGCDLRIVTPAGLDVWVPWLRARGADRRRRRGTRGLPSLDPRSTMVERFH